MHGDHEVGIPGHASHKRQLLRLQRALKELGFSFEAEGDVTRIHVNGALVEVRDEPGIGLALLLNASLPYRCSKDCDSSLAAFASVLSYLSREVEYELDQSIPEYPMLRARVIFGSVEELVESLISALERLRRERGLSI
ncbi:MAG: hypothetical protein N3F67_04030 [Acidilobaceae archaeon]|nr:hypothetical protein [Acidilobaceae archaeon]